MILNSSAVKRKCPICGAPNCACGGPSDVVGVDIRMAKVMRGGKLVRIAMGRGLSVQMYEEEARRRGLLGSSHRDTEDTEQRQGQEKETEAAGKVRRAPTGNKMRRATAGTPGTAPMGDKGE